ncbi:MBL fold metallo-hydrolase [Acidisoma silvae]|uniref:MBL fold metallo-hydrolase n=1 Tax=Acidisoma silvae TaxID=2802396 RepID=A0A964E048_9PROT|nr:MBL fold metallo-hydrolase [Acidisoma silvae]MCB8876782.1 MBL fold metallo-hydrolase [Acidisoma silvae]
MRVAPKIHLVASGNIGFSLSDVYDCNVWLIDTGDGLAMFDSGAGRDIASIFSEMTTCGLDPADLKYIFLTHGHADHSGGVAPILQHLSHSITLFAGAEAAARMQSHDETRISLDTARRYGVYPDSYRWEGATINHVLTDDAVTHIGNATIRLLETPGHSADHCSYLVTLDGKTALVSGDALFAGGTVFLQDIPDCSVTATLASVRRLAGLSFDIFLPGHGAFALKDGARHAQRAATFANRGLAPPNMGG